MSIVSRLEQLQNGLTATTKSLILMSGDIPVLEFNFNIAQYDVLDELHLPWTLKGRLKRVPSFSEIKTQYEDTQRQIIMHGNYSAILGWLSSRVLPITRENAKWIYNMLGVEQIQTPENKAKFAIMCRAVSLQDNYWLQLSTESLKWSDVDVRQKHLNEVLTHVALHGTALTFTGDLNSPEISTQGAYAKAWVREEDNLWLYKAGSKGNYESRIEVMVSNLLDKCNVEHIIYLPAKHQDLDCCKCKCMTTGQISILPGMDFISYCLVNGLNPDDEVLRIDAENIYKMWIVDYLISNRDRHGLNWGFFYDNSSMEILSCHPLYDHNNAFDLEWMQNPDIDYQFGSMTIRQAAHKAISKVDFHFTENIVREDFLTDRQYKSFITRARELSLV